MKYASSLLYGGMLVDAEKTDYKDYARLLLRCPFCGEAVFLVAGKHRDEHARLSPKSKQIVLVKAVEVKPAFAHFPGVASQNCELRSAKVNSSFIVRCATKSRHQRLKIFQNNFGKVFQVEDNFESVKIKDILKQVNTVLPSQNLEEIEGDARRDFRRRFTLRDNVNRLKDFARETCEASVCSPDTSLLMNKNISEAKAWLESLEMDMHLNIINETIDFMQTKSAYPLLNKLFDKGFSLWSQAYTNQNCSLKFLRLFNIQNCPSYEVLKKNYNVIIDGTLRGAVAFLCGIPWADFIKDCQKENFC